MPDDVWKSRVVIWRLISNILSMVVPIGQNHYNDAIATFSDVNATSVDVIDHVGVV